MGLTAFTRDFAKHAPLDVYHLMRVIAAEDRASLQLANASLGRDEDETVHENAPDHGARDALSARPRIKVQFIVAMYVSKAHRSTASVMEEATLFVPDTFCNLRSPSLIFDWIHKYCTLICRHRLPKPSLLTIPIALMESDLTTPIKLMPMS